MKVGGSFEFFIRLFGDDYLGCWVERDRSGFVKPAEMEEKRVV